ncbi:DUF881 domain-containing protein [Aeromicrobium sp.]|uniref:DUF881 domain-containing protein n=1 Tax=Aeromicrobium sp. TaxID=1871063 RepID=UPI003D6AA1F3
MPESYVSRFRRWSRPTGMHLLIGCLVGVLAFAMTTQISQDDATDYTAVRGVELVELLKSIDAANERLGTQIDDLTETRDELLTSSQRSEDAEKQARSRSDQLAILAGSAGATGPGVVVTIEDPDESVSSSQLLDAIQELRDAGAEAIAINGTARVVAQTYFLDEEGAIRVGGNEVKRPFTIEAIGDPGTMAEAVRFRGGLIDRVENVGGRATVVERDEVTITALADVKGPEYARSTS